MASSENDRQAVVQFGTQLRAIRTTRGLSQEKVALRAGISVHTYGCLERGESTSGGIANPTLATILRVLDALDIEAGALTDHVDSAMTPEQEIL